MMTSHDSCSSVTLRLLLLGFGLVMWAAPSNSLTAPILANFGIMPKSFREFCALGDASFRCLGKRTVLQRRAQGGSGGDNANRDLMNVDLLQTELDSAIANEDYSKAAALRDRLSTLKAQASIGVLQANAEFYRAFREGDFKAMDALWAEETPGRGDVVTCAHPGTPLLSGRKIVLESWLAILKNAPTISVENAKVVMYGDAAAVICEEHLGTSPVVQGPSAVCLATNIFVRRSATDSTWAIAHHHAGPVIPQIMRVERTS